MWARGLDGIINNLVFSLHRRSRLPLRRERPFVTTANGTLVAMSAVLGNERGRKREAKQIRGIVRIDLI